jgi:RNA polymerase sigma-70 factor (ECF subfamily)
MVRLAFSLVCSEDASASAYSSVVGEENEARLVEGAKAGDHAALQALLSPLHRELLAYAYRMLGGYQDAQDALQDASLRAWKNVASFERRASFRSWMYRIVSNTCFDMLRTRKRRVMPDEMGPPVEPGPPRTEIRTDIAWLEPYPDALLPVAQSPEEAMRARESIRLAFVRAIQLLPARQRAALILHDVLDWAVADIADTLEMTVAAVNSALQRARETIAKPMETSPAALDPNKSDVLARYVQAWETGNFDGFVTMLAADVRMSMPPWMYWLSGRDAVIAGIHDQEMWQGPPRPGRYRHVTASMNGQPAALAYVQTERGYVPMCMTVLTIDADDKVSELTIFVLPYWESWGFPALL